MPQRYWVKEYDNQTGMIAYSCLGARTVWPYSPTALSYFLNSSNYIKPPWASGFIRVIVGDGLLSAEHEEHKRQRRILNPAFAVRYLGHNIPYFWMKAHRLVDEWNKILVNQCNENQTSIDVMPWINRLTLDTMGLAGMHPFCLF